MFWEIIRKCSTHKEMLYSYEGQQPINSTPVELINYIYNYSKKRKLFITSVLKCTAVNVLKMLIY
jgi:hypothetical protein